MYLVVVSKWQKSRLKRRTGQKYISWTKKRRTKCLFFNFGSTWTTTHTFTKRRTTLTTQSQTQVRLLRLAYERRIFVRDWSMIFTAIIRSDWPIISVTRSQINKCTTLPNHVTQTVKGLEWGYGGNRNLLPESVKSRDNSESELIIHLTRTNYSVSINGEVQVIQERYKYFIVDFTCLKPY